MTLLTLILQVALSVFAEHPNRAGGNLCGYFPQDTTVTEAPAGYEPFYISLIARHGSRFLSSRNAGYFQIADTLAHYAEKQMLTDTGIALMEEIRLLHRMSEGNYGSLTELGAQEHRDICARMVRHSPGRHLPHLLRNGDSRLLPGLQLYVPRVQRAADLQPG